jgi:Golgi phosphoprotein 3
MSNPVQLTLPEELLLLALKEESGSIHWQASHHSYALAAGILAELLLAERIAPIGNEGHLEIITTAATGYPLLDDALTTIAKSSKPKSAQSWVQQLIFLPKLTQRVAEILCDRGIIEIQESRILFIFPSRRYPERDGRHEIRIIDRLRKAIFGSVKQLDTRTAILLALAHHTGLLTIPFDRKELKTRKDWIESVCNGQGIAESTKKAIEAVQTAAAVAVATTAAITAATS